MNRNLHESENQKKRILEKKPSAKVDIIFCDLSDLKTVRKAGEDYLAKNW